jgi:iron complex outermembrane receptor protein
MTHVRLVMVALAAILLGSSPLTAQQSTGTVTGTVTDAASMQPLQDATVQVGERTVLTNAQGRFLIPNVEAGSYTLRARQLGYATYTQEITVTAGQTTTVDVSLETSALALEGIVVIGYGREQEEQLTGVVEKVEAEEFNQGRIVSSEQLIQAKIPGVQVVTTGEPGGATNLRIRGGTSISSSNEPLFVVDGVPLDVGGGVSAGRNPLNFLNPQDIESVTVLKDAASTAIYGSRGANGVVIIETRSGSAGASLTYSANYSGSSVLNEPDMVGAARFRDLVEQFAPNQLPLLGNADTDWRDQILRNAGGMEHALAVSGGTEAMNYRLSLGYLDQQGVVEGTATERISAAVNYNHLLLDDRLRIEANLKGSRSDDVFTGGGTIGNATTFAPTQPIRDPGNAFGGYWEWENPLGANNPVAILDYSTDEGTTFRSVGSVKADYDLPFLRGFTATANVGYDVSRAERTFFAPSFLKGEQEASDPGQITRSNPSQTKTLLELYGNYVTALGDDDRGELDVTAGYTYEEWNNDFPFFEARGLASNLLGPNGVPGSTFQRSTLFIDEARLISFFGRLNYSLDDKYLVTLSLRRDGSSRFGPDESWGLFPAAAVAWRISEESFLEDSELFSDLKLRVSWGVNGNQAFANYQQFSSYLIGDPQARAQFGDDFVTTIRPSAADPGIKWEETTSYNVGVDFGLWENAVQGSIEYYHKETDDLIFNVPVAAGTNLSNFVTTNIGSLRNTGLELTLNSLIADGGEDGLSWEVNFNAATNNNEILQVNPVGAGDEQILTGGIAGGVGANIQVLQPGSPVNSFFVYRHIRDAAGNPIYEDVDGNGTIDEQDLYQDLNGDGTVNQDDRAPFEDPAPDWIFGHTSLLRYGQFDMSFTLLANVGNHVYNNVASNYGHQSALRFATPSNLHESVLETEFDQPQYFSDFYVEDASFLRMDNISLGYTFTQGRLEGARVFGSVQNVFTLTGYSGVDPTAGLNGIDNNIYPFARTYTAGVSITF